MAINWLVALKAVPWSDLAQAAPHIVKGARKLFTTARARAGGAVDTAAADDEHTASLSVVERLRRIETAAETLHAEQRATADLIRSLAEQNARVVEALAVLQARMRWLLGWCIVLTLAFGALAVWVLM